MQLENCFLLDLLRTFLQLRHRTFFLRELAGGFAGCIRLAFVVEQWLTIDIDLFPGEASSRRLCPDILRKVDQLVVPILQRDFVQIVLQMVWLDGVDALEASQVLQLILVLDPYFLLPGLLFLIVRGTRQALQPALLLHARIVYVPHLAAVAQVKQTH